jgi:hypothetical protein
MEPIKKKAVHRTIKSVADDLAAKSEVADVRMGAVENDIATLQKSINTGFEEMATLMGSFKSLAKNNPHQTTKGVHSEDVYQHDDEGGIVFEKNADPMADVEVVRNGLTSVSNAEFESKMEQMKFDEEPIEIMVMPSQSTFPDHTFTIGVNGRLMLIVRGAKQWMPRKYVEVLLRAKISSYGNFEKRNEWNGELEVQNPETKSHRYPLQVITDRNPKGRAWLVRVTNDTGA